MNRMRRRAFLACPAAALARPAESWADRLGILCQLGGTEQTARAALAAAREAGFRRVQVNFPWTKVEAQYLKGLPSWLRSEQLRCDVLSAYVNCLQPGTILMNTRAEDFARALDYAGEVGASRLVAWTGSHSADLMKIEPRNAAGGAEDAIIRFLEPHFRKIESAGLRLALETYVTLACPDAPSLRRMLDRLPASIGAVLDPPNLTPPARYAERDSVLREMFRTLRGRIVLVHMKDFRLAADGKSYSLPGPLMGEMNYPLFVEQVRGLPADVPIVAEHLDPKQFTEARQKLLAL